ncbi:cytochrome P450 89A2-like [Telopea speciosissima]|uniref:cytochrome P450 89A2-like n=1 Tax=Telopea speciosissima TaxID=54955 RepID=UPI001CC4E58A|nr:cytochrome P450 89A2-like [Telopea speciosissima]XP_043697149.1 cytochrome P450 89A2-like [Telopea speciosissima]
MIFDLESLLRELCDKYGPIITIRIFSRISIFIASPSLAHQALIQNGAAFNYRPGPVTPSCIMDNSNPDIGSSSGIRWRFLRRNLTSEVLTPSRYRSFGHTRKWVFETLDTQLKSHVESGEPVPVVDHFRYAMFSLLLFICFGEKIDEKVIKEIEMMERDKLANFKRFAVFPMFPIFGKIIFRKLWHQMHDMRRQQKSVMLPLIKSRRERKEQIKQENRDGNFVSYIDALFDLEIKEEGGRKVSDEEIMTLISEVLDAGSDTTSTVLEWIMAELVKDPKTQEKLYSEIIGVVGDDSTDKDEVREEDLPKMKYLRAVILEGLRLHPPSHYVLPHTLEEDIVLNAEYLIPKNALVNFMVATMGRDPKAWKDSMEFKPERYLGDEGEVIDITGSKEIKIMPFSAGRRICPGLGLGMLHLEFFVANMIKNYKWVPVEGDEFDMSEKQEFTAVMKTPLRAHVSPRRRTTTN